MGDKSKQQKPSVEKRRNPFLKPKVHLLAENLRNAVTENAKEAMTIMGKSAQRLAGTRKDAGDMQGSGRSARKRNAKIGKTSGTPKGTKQTGRRSK